MLAGGCALGLVDGTLAVARAADGGLGAGRGLLVIIAAAASWLGPCAVLGLFAEAAGRAAARFPLFVRFGRWAGAGPRRWFARDAALTGATLAALLGALVALGPVFPAALVVTTSFHSKALAATAVMLVAVASFLVAPLVAATALAPLRWVTARIGPLASPGVVALLVLAGALAETRRFAALHRADLPQLGHGAAYIPLASVTAGLATAAALGVAACARGRPVRRRVVAALLGAALAAFAWSAVALGRHPVEARVVGTQTSVTGVLLGALQPLRDRDHDGHSPLFGGGDCNDRDPAVHPGAVDVPGNGRDENCSGQDAAPELNDGIAGFTPLPVALRTERPAMLLVSVEGLDELGLLGCCAAPGAPAVAPSTRPALARFAAEAVRFPRAYTPSPDRLAAAAAVSTGRYPSQITWGADARQPALSPDNVTLAEQLQPAGYTTAVFTNTDQLGRSEGLFQGFEERHEAARARGDARESLRYLDAFLRARALDGRPFLAWIHLVPGGAPQGAPARDATLDALEASIGALREALGQVATKRAVVTALFGMHGRGPREATPPDPNDVREPALRTPLVFHAAGLVPRDVTTPASLLDVMPTLLNLAQRPSAAPLAGRSLVSELIGAIPPSPAGAPRELFAEGRAYGARPSGVLALMREGYALVGDRARDRFALYDLGRDPAARDDLFAALPMRAHAMRARALAWAEGAAASAAPRATVVAAARTREGAVPTHGVPRATFAGVLELLGAEVPAAPVPAGSVLRVRVYYRPLAATPTPAWLVLSLVRGEGPAGADPVFAALTSPAIEVRRYPLRGRHPTTQWATGEVLREEFAVELPAVTPGGTWRVRLAVESEPGLIRVAPDPVAGVDPDMAVPLGRVVVTGRR